MGTHREQIEYLLTHSRFYRSKLARSGWATAAGIGGLADITRLPLTEKSELRETCCEADPMGTHLAVPLGEVSRIYSTSGTTGTPSYIPLTPEDLDNWITISARSYFASGVAPGQRILTTYNAGPFVAGVALAAFDRLGLCHIPVGTGNTERLLIAIELLKPDALALTPSYALHVAEMAEDRGLDLTKKSIKRLLVAGEPGGGEPAMRARL